MKIKCCLHCTDRCQACHDNCKRYLDERKKLDESKIGYDAVDAYKRQRLNRIKGR